MLSPTIAQVGIPGTSNNFGNELPKPHGPSQTILWAVLGATLLLVIFGFVIKMKMDGDR